MRGVAPGSGSGAAGSGLACCAVGGTATPAARKTVPQVPWTSLRSRNRLPSCSTSTICKRSKWSLFTINGRVAMARGLTYSQSVRSDDRSSFANGVAPCQAPHPLTGPRSLTSSLIYVGALFAGELSRTANTRGHGWSSCSTNHLTYRTSQPGLWWNCTPFPSTAGVTVGHVATSLRRFSWRRNLSCSHPIVSADWPVFHGFSGLRHLWRESPQASSPHFPHPLRRVSSAFILTSFSRKPLIFGPFPHDRLLLPWGQTPRGTSQRG